ncbi:hypothetical protein MMC26_007605 [Xylographa opegraphella]|nr:hypothetical protein [Xylographa opegraphella]
MAGFCAGTRVPDCTANYTYITPDPDIDGIGVVVSFLVSAGLTLVTSLIGLVLQQLPTKPPKDSKPPQVDGDSGLWEGFRTKLGIKKESREYVEAIIERFVLGLADVQLLTGTSMLLVAFLKCDITTYHFSIITDLVWFSSSSHLTAMLILSDYLQEYHAARFWRVVLMGTMCLLLMVATILETNQLWYDRLPVPVRCTFLTTAGNMKGPIVGFTFLTFILLVYGYSTTVLPLFSPINDLIEAKSKRFENWMKASRKPSQGKSAMARLLYTIIKLTFKYVYYYFQYVNFLFDLIFYGLGVWFLFDDIAAGQLYMDSSSGGTQSWGFGQLMPMFLLSLPILTILEIFWGKSPFIPHVFRSRPDHYLEETKDFEARKRSKADAAAVKLRSASTAIPTGSTGDASRNSTSSSAQAFVTKLARSHDRSNEGTDSESDDENFKPASRQDTEQKMGGIQTTIPLRKYPTVPQAHITGGNHPSYSRPRAYLGFQPKTDIPAPRPVLATLAESSSILSHDGGQSSNLERRLPIPERRSTFAA